MFRFLGFFFDPSIEKGGRRQGAQVREAAVPAVAAAEALRLRLPDLPEDQAQRRGGGDAGLFGRGRRGVLVVVFGGGGGDGVGVVAAGAASVGLVVRREGGEWG